VQYKDRHLLFLVRYFWVRALVRRWLRVSIQEYQLIRFVVDQ
jgi:hypothetical protein